MTGTCQPAQVAAYFSTTASTPGFWSPIELSIPPGVSVTRGVGLPIRGLERRALAADGAEPVDVDDVAVLDAVAERPRRDEDRVAQDQAAAEVDGQVDVGSADLGRRSGAEDGGRPRLEPWPASGRPGDVAASRLTPPRGGSVTAGAWPHDQAPSQAISSAAKTGPSRQTRCGVPGHAMTTQPRHAPTAQPMFCSIETCRNALRRAAGDRPGRPCRHRACARGSPRRAAPRRPSASRARAASIGAGPQAKAWSAQPSYSATRSVT